MLARLTFVLLTVCAVLVVAQARSEEAPVEDAAKRLVLFWGTEAGRDAFGASGGFKATLGGDLDRSGAVVLGLANANVDLQTIDGAAIGAPGESWESPRGVASGSLLFGRQWTGPRGVFMLAAGPQIAAEQERALDGSATWRSARFGASVLGEIWAHPRDGWLATVNVTASSVTRSVWSRASLGVRLDRAPGLATVAAVSHAYVGPEASFYEDEIGRGAGWREMRVGAHLTGLKIGPLGIRIGAGVVVGDRRGGYVTLTSHMSM